MGERLTLDQIKSIYNGNIVSTRSKYNNQRTEYNGRFYDSKKEADFARQLDNLRKAKCKGDKVLAWYPQVKFELRGQHSKICDYYCDFVVKYADGHTEYIDVKGVRTDVYKIKKKLMKDNHDIDILER